MIRPWLEPAWRRLVEREERLPHAMLFAGPGGLGKRELAEELAARLLCVAPDTTSGLACGRCGGCQLRLSGNHPDLIRLVPEADASEAAEEGGADALAGSRAKSAQILIAQVRAVQEALTVTGHQGSRRVTIVDPAEAMNPFTANALLKLLEEPPDGCLFVLVSAAPAQLLPTIRSRCQPWQFGYPEAADVQQWGASQRDEDRALLALSGGLPLAAERLGARGQGVMLARFVRDIGTHPAPDPLRLAGQWEGWLKSKEAIAAGFGVVELVDWMQRWVTDLATLRLGGRVRYFPAQQDRLAALASQLSIAAVSNCYNEFVRIRRVARHPLNLRLMLEDMLLRYARALSDARP